jgi:hypothetical protein
VCVRVVACCPQWTCCTPTRACTADDNACFPHELLTAVAAQAAAHKGGVNSVQLDLVEQRFLLAGAADGSLAVYDVEHCGV